MAGRAPSPMAVSSWEEDEEDAMMMVMREQRHRWKQQQQGQAPTRGFDDDDEVEEGGDDDDDYNEERGGEGPGLPPWEGGEGHRRYLEEAEGVDDDGDDDEDDERYYPFNTPSLALDPVFLQPTGQHGPWEGEEEQSGGDDDEGASPRQYEYNDSHEDKEGVSPGGGISSVGDEEEERRPWLQMHRRLSDQSGASGSKAAAGGRAGRRRSSTGAAATYQEPPLSVMCRVRPLLAEERARGEKGVVSVPGRNRMVIANHQVFGGSPDVIVGMAAAVNRLSRGGGGGGGYGTQQQHLHAEDWARAFEFDRCFWSAGPPSDVHYCSQKGLYEEVGRDMLLRALLQHHHGGAAGAGAAGGGGDVSFIAYGASQSGKSYSLFGPDYALQELAVPGGHEELGLLPRVLLAALQHLGPGMSLSMSCLELNSQAEGGGLRDLLLLVPPQASGTNSSSSRSPSKAPQLRVREHPETGPFVENLTVAAIRNPQRLQQLLKSARRAMRLADGPAHTLITVYIERPQMTTPRRLQFVELAGSDTTSSAQQASSRRLSSSSAPTRASSFATPPRGGGAGPSSSATSPTTTRASSYQQRTAQLPHTLTLLSRFLSSARQQPHHHYQPGPMPRSCPLTWLLSRPNNSSSSTTNNNGMATSGGDRTYLLLCVSPSSAAYLDTLHTLKYGEGIIGQGGNGGGGGGDYLPGSSPGGGGGSSPVRDEDVTDWRLLQPGMGQDDDGLEDGGVEPPLLLRELAAADPETARRILKETVTDPQQRLARLQCALRRDVSMTRHKHAGTQTHLTGGEVVSRSSVPSSEEMWMLKSKIQQLEHDMQSLRLDRDVAVSEARGAEEEIKRVKTRDMQPLTDRIRELEGQVGAVTAERDRMDDLAKTVQGERDYVRQLLEETRAEHFQERQAREEAAAATGAKKAEEAKGAKEAHRDVLLSLTHKAEIEALQSRLLRSEAQYQEVHQLLWDAKARMAEVEQDKQEADKTKGFLEEELEATKAKLHQQTRAIITLKQQQVALTAAGGGRASSVSPPPPPPAEGARRRSHQQHPPLKAEEGDKQKRRGSLLAPSGAGDTEEPPDQSVQQEGQQLVAMEEEAERQRRRTEKEQLLWVAAAASAAGLERQLKRAREALRLKDGIILQQSQEARALAETLQRRVVSLERVAGLEGQALKEGLRREARTLSRELRGWTGRRSGDYVEEANVAQRLLAAEGGNQGGQAPATAVGGPVVVSRQPQPDQDALVASLEASLQALIEEKARLEELVRGSDQRAAKAMEQALVEVLMGVKDQNERVRQRVVVLDEGKHKAEEQVHQLQEKLQVTNDYRRMFRRELAALWLAVNKTGVLDAAKDGALQDLKQDLDQLKEKAHRLGEENCVLREELLAATTPDRYHHQQRGGGAIGTSGSSSTGRRRALDQHGHSGGGGGGGSGNRHSGGSQAPTPTGVAAPSSSSPYGPGSRTPTGSRPRPHRPPMMDAWLEDPKTVEEAVQAEIEMALESLLASRTNRFSDPGASGSYQRGRGGNRYGGDEKEEELSQEPKQLGRKRKQVQQHHEATDEEEEDEGEEPYYEEKWHTVSSSNRTSVSTTQPSPQPSHPHGGGGRRGSNTNSIGGFAETTLSFERRQEAFREDMMERHQQQHKHQQQVTNSSNYHQKQRRSTWAAGGGPASSEGGSVGAVRSPQTTQANNPSMKGSMVPGLVGRSGAGRDEGPPLRRRRQVVTTAMTRKQPQQQSQVGRQEGCKKKAFIQAGMGDEALRIVRTRTSCRPATEEDAWLLGVKEEGWRHQGEMLVLALMNELQMEEDRARSVIRAPDVAEKNKLIHLFEGHRERARARLDGLKAAFDVTYSAQFGALRNSSSSLSSTLPPPPQQHGGHHVGCPPPTHLDAGRG